MGIGIWSTGLLQDYDAAKSFKKPVFFFLGGSSDIAYGKRDYKNISAGIPKWKGNLNVGHGGTYNDANGGRLGKIGASWVQWSMRGNTTASAYMTGQGATSDGG
ncbi:hypothetical protein EJ02DRAFT_437206 [Clathrospora elynae]|uniref:Uncharacterized protein n=1 Tax=Clathrospora elynae TaxID=706981 RepID=A0A6A5SFG9_9PLEO|nr:hypothetical protein EJ02DRAFT_437206 [Clathrospora elynae]